MPSNLETRMNSDTDEYATVPSLEPISHVFDSQSADDEIDSPVVPSQRARLTKKRSNSALVRTDILDSDQEAESSENLEPGFKFCFFTRSKLFF